MCRYARLFILDLLQWQFHLLFDGWHRLWNIKKSQYNIRKKFSAYGLWNKAMWYEQKQPPRGVSRKSVLKICSKFTGEHPCRLEISIKLLCKFIEITLQHGCSQVNLLHIFRTPLPRNTSRLLLPYEERNTKNKSCCKEFLSKCKKIRRQLWIVHIY